MKKTTPKSKAKKVLEKAPKRKTITPTETPPTEVFKLR